MLSKKLSALVALSLITASSAAVAGPAQSLSLTNAPAAAHSQDANALDSRNGIGIYLIGAVLIGLIIWGGLKLFDNDDDNPSSP